MMRERDIFIAALEREDTANQAVYLAEACGDDTALRERVALLLEQHAKRGAFVLDRVAEVEPVEKASGSKPGQYIGPYKLIEKLGEGGFGEVWRGEQELPVRRTVAIKIIKLGMDTKQVIARFESERQALALMNHPNIATVLDVGATETGRPFFVMELVHGVPITDYCDAKAFDTRRRLDLFGSVCGAVQHAHQRGVIHRDLKPSNILVADDDGVATVKVIDFGIAKATNAEHSEQTFLTEDRQIIGTPVYMSPEQAEMGNRDIDTRCDVYSLGVLLYELLTGTTPFDSAMLREAGYGEMLRIIREDQPKKPSTRMSTLDAEATAAAQQHHGDVHKLETLIRGDLDWIVMKCLEKDRARRYAGAKELSDDILRHMHDEPVTAGPPSTSYRLRKFAKRNRGAVAAAAIVLATMTAGIIGTSVGMVRALDEQQRAEAARELAEKRGEETALLAGFHSALLSRFDLEELGNRISQEYVERLRHTLQEEVSGAQDSEPRLSDESEDIARAFEGHLALVNGADISKVVIGDYILAPAAAAASQQFAQNALLEASIRDAIGQNYLAIGLYDESETHLRWALETRQRELPPDDIRIAASAMQVAGLLFQKGAHDEAEVLLRMAADSCDFGATSEGLDLKVEILGGLGSLEVTRGAYEAAELLFREVLDGVPEDSPHAAMMFSRLATIAFHRSDFENAELLLREAIEKRTQAGDRVDQLSDLGSLGTVLRALGKHEDAERVLRRALEQTREMLGDEHPSVAVVTMNLAEVLLAQDKLLEAEPLFIRALAIISQEQGRMHPYAASVLSKLGVLLSKSGRLEESETHFREAIAIRRTIFGESHPSLAKPLISLATLLSGQDRFDEAEELLLGLVREDSANPVVEALRQTAREELVALYDRWHKKNPRDGHDAKAETLRAGD
ncbi:MAG: serine/threonine protein kinase [Planctomycetes bacterium]|nr:serine/threonine protein kinase [Planctomycetota bacterium]